MSMIKHTALKETVVYKNVLPPENIVIESGVERIRNTISSNTIGVKNIIQKRHNRIRKDQYGTVISEGCKMVESTKQWQNDNCM